MAADIDATIRLAMDQSFVEGRDTRRQFAEQFLQSANFVNQQVQLSHSRVNYMFESKAMGNLEEEGLADAILQQRSAEGQPGAPSGAPKVGT